MPNSNTIKQGVQQQVMLLHRFLGFVLNNFPIMSEIICSKLIAYISISKVQGQINKRFKLR